MPIFNNILLVDSTIRRNSLRHNSLRQKSGGNLASSIKGGFFHFAYDTIRNTEKPRVV